MMIHRTFRPLALVAALVLLPQVTLRAAIKASDSANGAAYGTEQDGAWKGTYEGEPAIGQNSPGNDNGGTGFLPWKFDGGYHEPNYSPYGTTNHFIDGVDFPASTFNNLGAPAFGLTTAHRPYYGTTAVAVRPFAQPLTVGDTFSADFDTPSIYDDITGFSYPFVFIIFGDVSGEDTLALSAGYNDVYGDFNWTFTDATNEKGDVGNLAPTATSDGSSLKLKMTSETEAQLTFDGITIDVTFKGAAPSSVSFALTDNSSGNGYNVDTVDFYDDPNGEREFFFNNLKMENGPTPGDFNNDGDVDGEDLVKWRISYGPGNGADGDSDNDSDGGDLLTWQRNVRPTSLASTVPEPSSLLLWLAALAMPFRRLWKRSLVVSTVQRRC